MTEDKSFLGRGWCFPPEFLKGTGGAKMVSAEEDIKESLDILFSTSPGERTMNPSFGCRLRALVFENIDESTSTEVGDIIRRAVLFFEPRITLNRVDVDDANVYEGRLDIIIDYTVRATNTRSNYVYPFYFKEATHAQL